MALIYSALRKQEPILRKTIWFGALVALLAVFASPSSAQTLLQVTTPTPGAVYLEGQIYTITVSVDPSVKKFFVLPEWPLPDLRPTADPLQFTLTLPKNITPDTRTQPR
jgi:hypothetical protein